MSELMKRVSRQQIIQRLINMVISKWERENKLCMLASGKIEGKIEFFNLSLAILADTVRQDLFSY